MGRKKHTEEQVISILREAKAGTKVQDLCRRYGASDDTHYHDRVACQRLMYYSTHFRPLIEEVSNLAGRLQKAG